MEIRRFAAAVVAACLAVVAAPAASAVVIDNFVQGTFSSGGDSAGGTIYTGRIPLFSFRSFLAFDLTGAPETAAASVTFAAGNGVLNTDTGVETLALWAFRGTVADLVSGVGGVAAFDQLGSGTQIGSATITGPVRVESPMPEVTVALSADFVAQLNALRISPDPIIAFGTSFPLLGFGYAWFGSSNLPAARLTLTEAVTPVDEPAPLALLALSGALLVLVRGRRGLVAASVSRSLQTNALCTKSSRAAGPYPRFFSEPRGR